MPRTTNNGVDHSLRARRTASPEVSLDRLPPHSPEAELAVLGCCLISPALLSGPCRRVLPELFYDLRHAEIWRAMRELDDKRKVVDEVTLHDHLKKKKHLDEVGGAAYIARLQDEAPSAENVPYYLDILREKFALRQTIRVALETARRAEEWEGRLDDLMLGIRADIETVTSLKAGEEAPALKIWSVDELMKWEPPDHLRLVGDNEICMGYEGLALIAGPGSSGKSLAAASLALAGATGSGYWMGRKVHRRFKTLIIQAENGPTRLRGEIEAMRKAHPEVPINEHIFISSPPEGGLPFHRAEFRVAVRREIERVKPDLVELDPWSQIAAEDSAKDVVDKLAEIRSCFPGGDQCPGLLIIAHTKKPRPEDVRRGRALTNLVSGSIALPNTARCVYLLLPWDEDLEEERIYWACSKLNNGKMYPASVWKRRFGTFFEHDPDTDPRTWGQEVKEDEDARAIQPADLVKAFGSESVLRKSTVAKRLEEQLGVGYSTVMRAITPGKFGYLSHMVEVTPEGWVKLVKKAKAKNAEAP